MNEQIMSGYRRSLEGKKTVHLGASSGIGLATAMEAASEGAQVIIVSGNQKKIDEALKSLPSGAEGFAVDLSREENIEKFFAGIGHFDHLVFSAGENLTLNRIELTSIAEARDFFTLRFWAAFASIKYGSRLINKGGSISLMSGTANARPGSGWSVASSICGAVEGLVRAMAVELAPIRVNCVVPGVIRTPLWNSLKDSDREALYSHYTNTLLLQRVGEARDVARGFIYLMTQEFGTGQALVIDGGTLLV